MTVSELDSLVAQIGEEILARAGSWQAVPGKKGEGLNLPDQVCPGCHAACPQTCARNTKEISAAGADRVSASERLTKIDPAIAALIDHTILKADATRADIVKVCREARQYGFASVCVNPYWVPLVRRNLRLAGKGVYRGRLSAGRYEHREEDRRGRTPPLREGAQEIDMVINIGALQSGDHEAVARISKAWCEASHQAGAIVKVILETALLDEIRKDTGLRAGEAGRRGFREDVHRLQHRRRDGARYRADAAGRGPDNGRQSVGRHPHAGRLADMRPRAPRASAPAPA